MSVTSALRFLIVMMSGLFGGSEAFCDSPPDRLVGHGGPIKAISVSADGKHALTAGFDYNVIYWKLSGKEGEIIHRLVGHDAAVNDVEFMSDSSKAVSVGDDGNLIVWNLDKGEIQTRIPGEIYKMLDIALSPDGRYAAATRWNNTASLYDLQQGKELAVLKGHRGNVNAVAFSGDGKRLYTAGYDGQIIEWDVETATMSRPVYSHGWGINTIFTTADNRIVFGALDGTVAAISSDTGELLKTVIKRERPVQSVKQSRDKGLFGVADGAGQIGVFVTDTYQPVTTGQVAFGPVWDFDFLPGSTQLLHVGLDDYAVRWQIAPKKFSEIKSKYPRRFQVSKSDDPGELEFRRKCSVCHTLTPDGANRAGPTLYGVFGRKAGAVTDYAYSDALKNSGIVWNGNTIARLFDDGPNQMIPGTKMPEQKLKTVGRRDDLIRFLEVATTKKGDKK